MRLRVACDHCGIHRDYAVNAFCVCGHSSHTEIVANKADRQDAVIAAAKRIDSCVSRGIPIFPGDDIAYKLHLACEALRTTIH